MKTAKLRQLLSDRSKEIVAGLKKKEAGEAVFTHCPTGLKKIDGVYGGIEFGVATLLVGHTGDGKSAVMSNLCRGAAETGGIGSILILIEDPQKRLADRYLASLLGIAANKLGRLDLKALDSRNIEQRLVAAVEGADWSDFIEVVNGDMSPDEIIEYAQERPTINGAPLGLLAIDYAQALAYDDSSLEEVCARTAKAANQLALDMEIATVFGSQAASHVLTRGKAQFDLKGTIEGFRISRGDAMWSRRLEQYCKAVWAILRPGRWQRTMGNVNAKDDRLDLDIIKANFGPEGRIELGWDGPTTTLYDLDK